MMRAGWSSTKNQLQIGEVLLQDKKSYGKYLAHNGHRG